MTKWNPLEAIQKPMIGLRFVEFHVSHHFLSFALRSYHIELLEIPAPANVFPEVDSAPELLKYCRAENGIKIKINAKANEKRECIGLYNMLRYDLSHPFEYLQTDDLSDIKLIYNRTYELVGANAYPDKFIEIRFPYVYCYADGYGNLRGNRLNKSQIDKYGNLIIRILPDEDACG